MPARQKKAIRSNEKKAFRTIKRHQLATNPIILKREAERFAKLQVTAENGKAAREALEKEREAQRQADMELEANNSNNSPNSMDVDKPKIARGITLTKKKKLKILKKKAKGMNTFHKKKGKKGKKRT